MRGFADRCRRLVRHRAQPGLRRQRACGLGRWWPVYRNRSQAHAERLGCGLCQRHCGAWRGFRRYLRRRSGACRRGDRAGGPGSLRAVQSRWPHGADRHSRRHRSALPVEPRGAEGRPQGRFSSDRDLRRHGRRRWRRRRARAQCQADCGRARHRRQHGRRHHRISRRGRMDQAAACGLGGIRAALLARQGFVGPRTVFEGVHGLFHGFAHTAKGEYDALKGDFGARWVTDTLAFKPYPCGTMAQPYIDCARRLAARGVTPEDINEIVCEVAEGTVHRLWEPLADKQRPRNGYSAKFAVPYLLATGFVHGGVGLGAFTEAAIGDRQVLALAAKVKFVIDPDNPYPNSYTGHVRATMKDGSVIEERQPYLRGGTQEPLTRQDVTEKFALNAQHGGWATAQSEATLKLLAGLYDGKIDLSPLRS